jgi:hypothetical protein
MDCTAQARAPGDACQTVAQATMRPHVRRGGQIRDCAMSRRSADAETDQPRRLVQLRRGAGKEKHSITVVLNDPTLQRATKREDYRPRFPLHCGDCRTAGRLWETI